MLPPVTAERQTYCSPVYISNGHLAGFTLWSPGESTGDRKIHIYVDICGYMWIHVDTWGYMGIYVDISGYMWIHAVASRGGQGGGAIALEPGPVVGARAKLDFFCALIGSQWGIRGGGGPGMITPPPRTCPDTENLCKVFFGGRMTSRGQCPRGGGACECPRGGVFFNIPECG